MARRLTPAERVEDSAPEDEVLAALIDAARFGGWLVSHHRDSRSHQGDPGLPDLVCAHPRRGVVFIEAKTRAGRLSDDQRRWRKVLESQAVWLLVRPATLPDVVRWLTARVPAVTVRSGDLGPVTLWAGGQARRLARPGVSSAATPRRRR